MQPRFEEPVPAALQGKRGQPLPAPGQSVVEWVQLTGGTGNLGVGVEYRKNHNMPLTIDDFDLLKVVSFGKVMQVRKLDTS